MSQGTRVFRSREATMLLGVEGLAVVSVVEVDGVRQVHAVTDDPTAAACPACGVISTAVKGHAVSSPRDLPYGPVPIRLVWHKRRWRCREPLCERASFTESIPAIPARSRLTSRLRTECGEGIADRFTCVAAGAVHYGLSWRTAHAAYVRHVAATLAAPLPPVTVLGIDEIRRGKTRWVKDPDTGRWVKATDRWLTGLVDAAGDGGLLAHVEGRAAAAIVEWVEAQPDTWRAAVAHVCLDLSASYAKAIRQALPDATLVADRFHLVRLANDMLTQVRQDATRTGRGRRGRRRDPEWANRRRLLTGHERLTETGFATMWNSLMDEGDLGVDVLHAYTVKELLRDLLALTPTPDTSVPNHGEISHRLWKFNSQAATCDIPAVHRLAATIQTWWPAVEAAITTGHSNARSEGYNRLAKHQGRNAFGFRNTANQTRRIRWACTRQHRRAVARTTELPAQV